MAEQWTAEQWEDEQLDEARIKDQTRHAVKRLLAAWRAHTGEHKVNTELAFETFMKLAKGEALVTPDRDDEVWQPVTSAGQVHVRDEVRVRADAYADEAGRMHNRRRGRVLAVRYGDVVIRYTDGRQPPFDGVHHPPTRLERRIR